MLDLRLTGLPEPIGTTATHPFWSLDRGGWTPAGELRPGERLQTLDGEITVERLAPRPGVCTVYNLEVQQDHTFFVSDAKVWVHNNGCFEETFARLEDALGPSGLEGVTVVGGGSTRNADVAKHGFTDVVYVVDKEGDQGTVFFNPSTWQYGGALLSSSN